MVVEVEEVRVHLMVYQGVVVGLLAVVVVVLTRHFRSFPMVLERSNTS